MRNRKVQILFRLTDDEAEQLHELVRKSGRSREAFLREMVKGYRLCEKPDPEFYKIMRELSAIGNNVNQIAYWANAQQSASEADIQEAAALVRRAWRLVKETL